MVRSLSPLVTRVIKPELKLACGVCHWLPPDEFSMADVSVGHFLLEHNISDADKLQFELVAVCTCKDIMTFIESRPTGGGHMDYFKCDGCGQEARLRRDS